MVTHIEAVFLEGKLYSHHQLFIATKSSPRTLTLFRWSHILVQSFGGNRTFNTLWQFFCQQNLLYPIWYLYFCDNPVIMSHFEAVFFMEKLLINLYQIICSHKKTLMSGTFRMITHFYAVFFKRISTSNTFRNALPPKKPCGNFFIITLFLAVFFVENIASNR